MAAAAQAGVLLASRFPLSLLPDVPDSVLWSQGHYTPDREKLRQHSFWYGRGGAVEHTISGLDIALWDLMGKALGQPVSRLLGGNYRDRIKPYASILFDDPPVLREKLEQQLARGFRAIRPSGAVRRRPLRH